MDGMVFPPRPLVRDGAKAFGSSISEKGPHCAPFPSGAAPAPRIPCRPLPRRQGGVA